jgi:mRNA-degrading endonuclease HigB of HigAB toxin-antitoxin module
MLLYGYPILDDFATRHSKCRGPLAAWRVEVEDAVWTDFADLQRRYVTAAPNDVAGVVFNVVPEICLVATKVNFVRGIVVVERAWAKRRVLRQTTSRKAA